MIQPKPYISPVPFMVADANLHRINEQRRIQKFGHVRPAVHVDHQGVKYVAVGSQLYSGDWKTPIDFLFDFFIKRVFSPSWGKTELKKPLAERHPVMQWYNSLCALQSQQTRDATGVYGMVPNGAALSYLLLSYDLFTLRQHEALEKSLIQRWRRKDHFQGARYELFAIATCIRAGCTVEFENESDGLRKHVEFTATHRTTGQRFALEAKSRHRPGVLGFEGDRAPDEQVKVGIQNLIKSALKKPTAEPFVLFLDLNLPPSSAAPLTQEWFDKIGGPVVNEFGQPNGHDPWNMVLFTNAPHHYGDDADVAPSSNAVALFGRNPKVAMPHSEVLRAVFDAALKYGNLPSCFDEL
jgi:hypothetical protein